MADNGHQTVGGSLCLHSALRVGTNNHLEKRRISGPKPRRTLADMDSSKVKSRTKSAPLKAQISSDASPTDECVRWHVVKPPKGIKKVSSDCTPGKIPRIWAGSRAELLAVVPELTKSVNGISWTLSETPIMILEGNMWPNDRWGNATTFKLTIIRDFSCPPSMLIPNAESCQSQAFSTDSMLSGFPTQLMRHNKISQLSDRRPSTSLAIASTCGHSSGHPDESEIASALMLLGLSQLEMKRGRDFNRQKYGLQHLLHLASQKTEIYNWENQNQLTKITQCSTDTLGNHSQADLRLSRNRSISLSRTSNHYSQPVSTDMYHEISNPSATLWSSEDVVLGEVDIKHFGPSGGELSITFPTSLERNLIDDNKNGSRANTDPCQVHYSSEMVNCVDYSPASTPGRQMPSHKRNHPSSRLSVDGQFDSGQLVNVARNSNTTLPISNFAVTNVKPISTMSRLEDDKTCDQRVPNRIPPEIQVLIESYQSGVPVVVIMSRDCSLIPLPLPLCYAYSYLGFFRLTELHSQRIESDTKHDHPENFADGRIKWQLTFSWASGGEDFIGSMSPLSPWWSPSSQEDTPPEHKQFSWRDLRKFYPSFLPLQLHESFGSSCGEFPRGWHCTTCGRLNEQILLRHRRCLHCQVSTLPDPGHVVELDEIRESFQQVQIPLPHDLYPDSVEASTVIWDDGMRTFTYEIRRDVVAKHIFTCNHSVLQAEPTALFHGIQLHVELSRQHDGKASGVYFSYLVGLGHDHKVHAVSWEDVHPCVKQAQQFLCHQGCYYGEYDIVINKLIIVAWIVAGSKLEKIQAKKSSVMILCLGADVVLSLVPEGGFSSNPSELDDDTPSGGPTAYNRRARTVLSRSKQNDNSGETKTESRRNALVIQLVHGDILMLNGDDFQCRTKRTGITILLFGSCAPQDVSG